MLDSVCLYELHQTLAPTVYTPHGLHLQYILNTVHTFSVFAAVHLVLYPLQHLLTAVLVTLIYSDPV